MYLKLFQTEKFDYRARHKEKLLRIFLHLSFQSSPILSTNKQRIGRAI